VINSGTGPLTITDISVSGHDHRNFSPTYGFSLPVIVSPGGSIAINLTFTPSLPWTPGTRSARLEISEGANSHYVPLTGIGATCGGPLPACSSGCPDSDGDGLNDAWEIAGGIDIDNDGVIDPTKGDVLLPGADPNRPDVYLHYDYTTGTDGHNHNPPAQALAMVTAAFAAHGVTLHIDPAHTNLCEHPGDPGCVTVGSGAYVTTLLKNPNGTYATQAACVGPNATTPHSLRAAFPYLSQIKPAYHYMIFSHFSSCDSEQDCTLGCPPDNLEASECALVPQQPGFGAIGSAEILGDDSIVSLGRFTDAGRPIPLETWAGIIMHELGHNFGLLHGGLSCTNYDPNYVSVMNYWFTQHGIPVSATPGSIVPQACATDADCTSPAHCSTATNTCFRVDYSSLQLPTLNKSALDETIGLNAGQASTDITFYFGCGGACSLAAPTNGSPIDWDNDGDVTETSVSADINNDGSTTDALSTQNDWAQSGGLFRNLTFSFQCTPGFGD
jgi:hypothetical protein